MIFLSQLPKDKAEYIKIINSTISNNVYLNINNFYTPFNKPTPSKLTEGFTFLDRIIKPSHEVILELAQSNMEMDKIAIIDGDYDPILFATYLPKIFKEINELDIRIIHFDDSDSKYLKKISNNILYINTYEDSNCNNKKMYEFLCDFQAPANSVNKGTLVMSAGLAGMGKTTVLMPVAQKMTNCCYLDSDYVTEPFLIGNPIASDYYGQYVKNPRYESIFAFALDNISIGNTAIVDGCFGDKLTSSFVRDILNNPDIRSIAIYCHASGPIQEKRIRQRGAERDNEKLKDLPSDRRNNIEKHLIEFSQVQNLSGILFVDTENNVDLEQNKNKIYEYITSENAGSLKIHEHNIPYSNHNYSVTKEEAQGGLQKFKQLLNKTIKNNQMAQDGEVKNNSFDNVPLAVSLERIWADRSVKIEKPKRLPAENIHQNFEGFTETSNMPLLR